MKMDFTLLKFISLVTAKTNTTTATTTKTDTTTTTTTHYDNLTFKLYGGNSTDKVCSTKYFNQNRTIEFTFLILNKT